MMKRVELLINYSDYLLSRLCHIEFKFCKIRKSLKTSVNTDFSDFLYNSFSEGRILWKFSL